MVHYDYSTQLVNFRTSSHDENDPNIHHYDKTVTAPESLIPLTSVRKGAI